MEDSFTWQAPGLGRYAILYMASTDEKEAVRKTTKEQYHLFNVSALHPLTRQLPDKRMEVIVVDAFSGQPVEGADVKLNQVDYRTNKSTLLSSGKSDAEGRVLLSRLSETERSNTKLEVTKGDDRWLPTTRLYSTSWNNTIDNRINIH